MHDRPPFTVLIAGGGCGALEAAFRLQRVAEDRVQTTILTPDAELATHAMAVLVPFAAGHVPREPLARLAREAGARLRRGSLKSVDSDAHHVVTDDGEVIAYDALLIAVGGQQRAAGSHVLTFGHPGTEEQMHGLIQDVEEGWVRRVAFVVPADATWPVPLYELALMTAERAYGLCQRSELTFVTAEPAPLALFGPPASRALTERLHDAGIEVHTAVAADVSGRVLELHPSGERLTVDRVVTLPSLSGPCLEGLPHDADGCLVVDRHGRVRGVSDVYAAGDVTHHPIKQGGLACQQADAAADAIAAQAGAAIEPELYEPLLEGVLLTERSALLMRRERRDDTAVCTAVAAHPFYGEPIRVEHWANALHQGPAAARNMLGRGETFDRLPYFFSDQYEVGMEYSGFARAWDRVVFRGDPAGREFIVFWLSEDRVVAGMNVNVWDVTDPIRNLIRDRVPVADRRLADPEVALEDLAAVNNETA